MKPLDSNGTQCQGQAAQYEEVLSMRQHMSANVSMHQRIPLDSDGRQFQVDPVQYENTSAYVSIRQHTSAYDGRQLQGGEAPRYKGRCRLSHPWGFLKSECRFCSSLVLLIWVLSLLLSLHTTACTHYVSIRQLTTAFLSVDSLSSACIQRIPLRQHTSAYYC
jgi:hypothetical protein